MCYVDDVVIATPTLEDHIDRLDEVFGCMKRAGLKCKPSKCEIQRSVRPDPEAVEAVLTWKAPRTDTQLLSFLGFANYYREFIKGYADKVYPMQKLMRNKGKKFEWNDEAQVAFENIKRELCEAPVLGMPTEEGMYVLDTDASVVAISGILHQEQEWNGRTVLRPIAYGSKVLSDTEMKYGAPKAEMFAVVTSSSKRKKTVTFVDQDKEGEKLEQNLLQDYLSGDRYLIPGERVFDNAADDLETVAVSKRSISLLPQKEVVRD